MSFREEERQKSNCPSRGLGLAAAAIGVGVGAALYYFFSKRPEHPDGEGSSASVWQTETLMNTRCNHQLDVNVDSDSYTTISEYETTDTSINSDGDCDSMDHPSWTSSHTDSMSVDSLDVSDTSNNDNESTDEASNSDLNEWDVTDSSMYINEYSFPSTPMLLRLAGNISSLISPRRETIYDVDMEYGYRDLTEEEQMNILRDQAYRERDWTTEECSICFEVIRRNQEVMTLPCTHNFHQACILPWLQEQQTCPNCRKRTE